MALKEGHDLLKECPRMLLSAFGSLSFQIRQMKLSLSLVAELWKRLTCRCRVLGL